MITNETEKKQKLKENKGITLIALVITIIVLLILAGVTISTLTGENGILNQAGNAKDKTAEADAIERVQVEVLGSYGTDGKIDLDQLNKNLRNINGLTYNGSALSDSNKIDNLPATVTLNGYNVVIEGSGSVRQPNEIEKAKANGTIFVDDKTTITDAYGNSVTIPKGFKIASDSATDVTGGIVIEDATYTNTIGSQFVWIPVGTGENAIKKSDGSSVDIALGRYVFDSSGNIDTTLSKTNPSDQLKTSSSSSNYFTEGLKNATTTNTHAKDIETFINSANSNHGYYIGRYEARKNLDGNLTVVGTDNVYNNITQSNAATESRNMYDGTVPFTSDLMNSFAWDTSIIFEQTFDDRTAGGITKPYSLQKSLIFGLQETGTNGLTDTSKQDKICNIWDMASNCVEWTTETSSAFMNGHDAPCVARGDHQYYGGMPMEWRNEGNDSGDDIYVSKDRLSFRPILYL